MPMSTLAILGGKPVIDHALPPYRSMGPEEKAAVAEVIESDCLSGFYGSWGDQFYGGPKVRKLEQAWAARFGTKHAVTVNSATSGLIAAMGAIGIGPGDEVIVPPYTMSATAMAPLFYGGIPVFADIEPDTFCLDVDAVRACLSPRTRAILVVNLMGHPARLAELKALAVERGIRLVEDNAQGPLAMENGRYAGTVGDIGVFSLNYHKHIHTGEGGVCVTDDDGLAARLQMIRNHGENVVDPLGVKDIANLVGFNFRMTELSAAVGIVQLAHAEEHVAPRQELAEALSAAVRDLPGLTPPAVRKGCRHVYYVWALRYDESVVGVPRAVFSRALDAEGFRHGQGYVEPLYRLPVFRQRKAFGREGYPFSLTGRTYPDGLCPVVERMYGKEVITFEPCACACDAASTRLLQDALRKVYEHRGELRSLPAA